VSSLVWAREGWIAGIITFLAVGFADASWTYAWWNEPELSGPWYAAAACALASVISWGVRPFTRPLLIKLGIEEGEQLANADRQRESVHHEVPTTGSKPASRSPNKDRPGDAA